MDLTVVVPTMNEAGNVACLVQRTSAVLAPLRLDWELLFVDDSDDATPALVLEYGASGYPVRLLHRPTDQRPGGLGGAVVAGLAMTDAAVVAVMDGDLQHRPEVLVDLVGIVRRGDADVAVASRRTGARHGDAGLGGWWRDAISTSARSVVHLLFPPLRGVVDPLSGFFALDRRVIDGVELRPEGYKILLEVLVRGTWRSVIEVPHELDARLHGESKARLWQGLAFAHHLGRLMKGSPSNQGMRNDLDLPSAASGDSGRRTLATSRTGRRAPGTSR